MAYVTALRRTATALVLMTAWAAAGDVIDGRTVRRIASIGELYSLQSLSHQHVILAPGVYPLNRHTVGEFGGAWPSAACPLARRKINKCAALFNFSGSNNVWDLRGTTIEFDTSVFRNYTCLHGPHGLGSVLGGSRNVWNGLTWRDVAPIDGSLDYAGYFPGSGDADFVVQGCGHVLEGLSVALRGSGVYGFGALYGKGKHNAMPGVAKSKRAVLAVIGGANITIRNSVFDHSGFGHLVHIHDKPPGSSLPHTANITFVNCSVRGEVRMTNDLLRNGVSGADRNGVPWRIEYNGTLYAGPGVLNAAGQDKFAPMFDKHLDRTDHCVGPIAPGKAFALTEDGFRNYDGVGMVTLKNCTAAQTRCGLCLMVQGSFPQTGGAIVDGFTARSVAPHGWSACAIGSGEGKSWPELGEAYQPPSHSRLTRCQGDATFVPLLTVQPVPGSALPVNISADIGLLDPEEGSDYARTDDALAIIEGSSHFVRLWGKGGQSAKTKGLKIYVGRSYVTSNVTLCNLLPVPVVLGVKSMGIRVWSIGNVINQGRENLVAQLNSSNEGPDVCAALRPYQE